MESSSLSRFPQPFSKREPGIYLISHRTRPCEEVDKPPKYALCEAIVLRKSLGQSRRLGPLLGTGFPSTGHPQFLPEFRPQWVTCGEAVYLQKHRPAMKARAWASRIGEKIKDKSPRRSRSAGSSRGRKSRCAGSDPAGGVFRSFAPREPPWSGPCRRTSCPIRESSI